MFFAYNREIFFNNSFMKNLECTRAEIQKYFANSGHELRDGNNGGIEGDFFLHENDYRFLVQYVDFGIMVTIWLQAEAVDLEKVNFVNDRCWLLKVVFDGEVLNVRATTNFVDIENFDNFMQQFRSETAFVCQTFDC